MTSGIFGSTLLDTVVGLFFIYLLLSLICSTINELIAGYTKRRASMLRKGINNLLGESLAAAVCSHPLIERTALNKEKGPSYIPAPLFAQTLLLVLANKGAQSVSLHTGGTLAQHVQNGIQKFPNCDPCKAQTPVEALRALIGSERDPQFLQTLKADVAAILVAKQPMGDSLEPALKALDVASTSADIRAAAGTAPASAQKMRALSKIDTALNDLTKSRKNIEDWFNVAMDRLSGEYARDANKWLFCIACVVSVAIGADSRHIALTLYNDPAARAAIVTQTQQAITPNGQSILPVTNTVTVRQSIPITDTAVISNDTNVISVLNQLDIDSQLFGYHYPARSNLLWSGVSYIVATLLGILVTVFALTLGAPFWFSLLRNLVNLRSGTPSSTSTTAAVPGLSPIGTPDS